MRETFQTITNVKSKHCYIETCMNKLTNDITNLSRSLSPDRLSLVGFVNVIISGYNNLKPVIITVISMVPLDTDCRKSRPT